MTRNEAVNGRWMYLQFSTEISVVLGLSQLKVQSGRIIPAEFRKERLQHEHLLEVDVDVLLQLALLAMRRVLVFDPRSQLQSQHLPLPSYVHFPNSRRITYRNISRLPLLVRENRSSYSGYRNEHFSVAELGEGQVSHDFFVLGENQSPLLRYPVAEPMDGYFVSVDFFS